MTKYVIKTENGYISYLSNKGYTSKVTEAIEYDFMSLAMMWAEVYRSLCKQVEIIPVEETVCLH